MRLKEITRFLLLSLTLVAPFVYAQFFAVCGSGNERELKENIRAHCEHTYRLDQKFLKNFYHQGPLPSDLEFSDLDDIQEFLRRLGTRKAAILFHTHRNRQLCTWLITASRVHCNTAQLEEQAFSSLRSNLMNALNVTGAENKREPVKRGVKRTDVMPLPTDCKNVLEETSKLLLPERILRTLLEEKIDTLVIVPISTIGTLPFATFTVGSKMLVDFMSVVIAPGFFIFMDAPRRCQHDFSSPIIVGDPQGYDDPTWTFPPLPGARAEAEDVAKFLKSKALIGSEASKRNIELNLKAQPRTGLIYLATHGIADMTNPRNASFLLLSDGRWPAIEIQNVNLRQSRPLVVMSACQTGLGKDFDVGTIGMTRAWHRAGASSVVMSLWSIDDATTRKLMINFMELAIEKPADKALQQAMQATRKEHPDPALWAGFSVFGAPQL
jgi:CHAT domain-containing protein